MPNKIMIDFEKGLQNAVKDNFSNLIIDGCFFIIQTSFVKNQKFRFMYKTNFKNSKLLIFVLKLLLF